LHRLYSRRGHAPLRAQWLGPRADESDVEWYRAHGMPRSGRDAQEVTVPGAVDGLGQLGGSCIQGARRALCAGDQAAEEGHAADAAASPQIFRGIAISSRMIRTKDASLYAHAGWTIAGWEDAPAGAGQHLAADPPARAGRVYYEGPVTRKKSCEAFKPARAGCTRSRISTARFRVS